MPEHDDLEPEATSSARKVGASSIIVGVLLAALTATIVVQWRSGNEASDFSGVRGVELVELLKSLDAANVRLAQQIDNLTAERNALRSSSESTAEAEKNARRRAQELAILAGTAPATGPGVTVTIEADPGEVTAAVLLDAVEELRDAGAEVIALNGVARIVAQTYFVDDADGIRVSGRLVQGPFVFEVIGDAATLAEAVRFRGGLADVVEARGGAVRVDQRDRIEISVLAEPADPQYATATQ